ncbi:hypothetical protein [uncultured Paracoccus sp.]|uniref:hypothetical protein n=1 Tax=uncultured Paracoccus sp. TaxID=189685 RepID=UPI0026111DDE|nr:hypothetical protein [uncultured Paracoccus sp.]
MNDTNTTERAPRGRVEAERTERRRRQEVTGGRRYRLSVSGKDPNYEYRWINDIPGRVHQLTKDDDWDVVQSTGGKGNTSVGTLDERVVDANGRKAILVRKRKEWYEADKRKEQGIVEAREEGLRRGVAPNSEEMKQPDGMYVPQGGISIGRDG